MKRRNMNRQVFYRLALLCGAVLAVATVGWARTYHMTSTKAVPAAGADVVVGNLWHRGKDKNGNTQFVLKAKHLAKPGLLTPPANSYVVWLQQEGSQPQSQGELKIGNNLKGELKATTPLKNFNVFITAETDSQTKTPSDQVILQATVQQ
jgi:hypothetical protein